MTPRTEDHATQAWIAARQKSIGATDASAILGANKWRSALDVYFEKTGRGSKTEESWILRRGLHMEAGAKHEFSAMTGRHVIEPAAAIAQSETPEYMVGLCARSEVYGERVLVRHPTIHAHCTPDFFALRDDGIDLGEVKTAQDYARDEWLVAPPRHYWIQVQHSMMVCGIAHASIVVVFWNEDPLVIDIPADIEFQTFLSGHINTWWERHVVGNTPPDPVLGVDTASILRATTAEQTTIDLGPEAAALDAEIAAIDASLAPHKQAVKDLDEVKDLAKSKLLLMMGEHAIARISTGAGTPVYWRRTETEIAETIRKAYTMRKFARWQPKK